MAPPNWTGPALMPGVNTSPLGSNVSATPPSGDTSEESGDDCHSIAQVRHFHKIIRKIILKNLNLNFQINANKRPSPEPIETNTGRPVGGGGQAAAKKAKVTQAKKKKRRDPHEPQK